MVSQIMYSVSTHTALHDVRHQMETFSASLDIVRGIHRWSMNSPYKRPVTPKMFPFDDVTMTYRVAIIKQSVLERDQSVGEQPFGSFISGGFLFTETRWSSGWLLWSSLGTFTLVYNVSSDEQGSDPDHLSHHDVIKWKHFPCNWTFERGIHRSPVNSPHKGQWRGALMFSLICAWINAWVNNREAGDLRRNRAHYDVSVIVSVLSLTRWCKVICKDLCVFPGSTSGIGADVAVSFAREGARVVITGRRTEGLQDTITKCIEAGASADAVSTWTPRKPPLKRNYFGEIAVTGCAEICRNDNFRCSQRQQFHQNDISIPVHNAMSMSLSLHCVFVITDFYPRPVLAFGCCRCLRLSLSAR